MMKVGLTGGIASGKSHVLHRLAAAGFRTLDLDAVARDVMAPGGAAYDDVAAAFGRGVLARDGTIDRKALGARVFADVAARRRLEALVHPRIRDAEARALAGDPDSIVVVDAALLVESGQHLRFARLVVVFCEPSQQLRRLMARDGLDESAARARLDAQMPPAEKKRFGHFVVDNSGARGETDAQVDTLIHALRSMAAAQGLEDRIPVARAAAALAAGPRRGPGGLDPWTVLEDIARTGVLDMARMAALLDPPHDGPWYEAPVDGAPPETLAVPVAAWTAGQRPRDLPFTVAAAASMARLTHRDPAAQSGGVLGALAALHFLRTGEAASLRGGLPEWTASARGWTGAAPPPSTVATVLAAAAHAGDGEAAAREAAAGGGVPHLARALAGVGSPAPLDPQQIALVARVVGAA